MDYTGLSAAPASSSGSAHTRASSATGSEAQSPERLRDGIVACLDDNKAENIVTIELKGKSSIADYMVIASGRSHRHVGAVAEHVVELAKKTSGHTPRVEGLTNCDWVLIDAGDVVVHVFRPEVRDFYNLERLWSADMPEDRRLV